VKTLKLENDSRVAISLILKGERERVEQAMKKRILIKNSFGKSLKKKESKNDITINITTINI
jgi:hypothetical protein